MYSTFSTLKERHLPVIKGTSEGRHEFKTSKFKRKESKTHNFNTCLYLKVSERKLYKMNEGKLIGDIKLGKENSQIVETQK